MKVSQQEAERLVRSVDALVWKLAYRRAARFRDHARREQEAERYHAAGIAAVATKVIEKFDPARGVKFSTYVYRGVQFAFVQSDRTEYLLGDRDVLSLDAARLPSEEGGDDWHLDPDRDRRRCETDPHPSLTATDWVVLLGCLRDARQREMFRLRYFASLRLHEIADQMGISKQRVAQIVAAAVLKLRRSRRVKRLLGRCHEDRST